MYKMMTCAGLGLAGMTGFAFAEEDLSRFSYEFVVELENDYTFDSTDDANELNDTFFTIEGALSYALTDNLSINSSLVFEPVEDAVGDRFIEDHGLFAEELFFSYENEHVGFSIGKFNPAFGFAWDLAPGIFGVDFAEDYEITEQLGVSVAVPFSYAGGDHEFSVAFFHADTTIFSESLGENRGNLNQADGGLSNTDSPESISIALSGEFGSTGYNVGIQRQAAGIGDVEDQVGYVLGVVSDLQDVIGAPVEVLGEVVYFDEFDGTDGSAVFATVGASVPVGPVTLSAVYSLRDVDNGDSDHLATVSAEMELFDGLSASVGYRYGDEEGEDNHTFGTLLVYEF